MNATLYEGYIIVTVDEKDMQDKGGITACETVQHVMEEFQAHLEEIKDAQETINHSKEITQERLDAICKD